MQYNITSRQNPRIVEINKLKLKKMRNETGLGIIEGERIVNDVLQQKIVFKTLVVLDSMQSHYQPILKSDVCEDCLIVSQDVFDALSTTQNSQGIMAVVKIDEKTFALPKSKFLVLDSIQDPGNLGTILRTAVALDYTNIFLYNCVDFRNDKVLRATMGTIFKTNLTTICEKNLQQLSKSCTLLLADAAGEPLGKCKMPSKDFGIVLCNEGNGASVAIKNLKTKKIAIKMQNQVESLNVSIAGAILMYALGSLD